jgi:tRNA threonylcarbamoyladenosine biosynthesis protein TsaE
MRHDVDDSPSVELPLPDEAATLALGARLAKAVSAGMAIWLVGDLGAGKTTLTRGLLRGLDFTGRVKSPTYTLVEIYPFSSFNLYHFDLYRFIDPEEWEEAGFREYFNPQSICLVEWPEKGGASLPPPDLEIRLDIVGESRLARLRGRTEEGRRCVEKLLEPCAG